MDGGVVFFDNLHFLDSQIGKVDQDGQIEIWKSIQSTSFFIFTKTFLSQIFSNQDYLHTQLKE